MTDRDDRFNASLDKATDAVILAFGWLAPADNEGLGDLMIELDGAISEIMSAYVGGTDESHG